MVGATPPPLVCYSWLDYLTFIKYRMRAWRNDHCVASRLIHQLVEGSRWKAIWDLKYSACVAHRRAKAPNVRLALFRNCDGDFYLEAFKQKSGESGRFSFSEEVASRHPANCTSWVFGYR